MDSRFRDARGHGQWAISGRGVPPDDLVVTEDSARSEKVHAYFLESDGTIEEADDFCDAFEAANWRLSSGRGGPVKSWPMCAARWIRQSKRFKRPVEYPSIDLKKVMNL